MPGADVGHVRFDDGAAIGGQRNIGGRRHQQVASRRNREAHADKPLALAGRAGFRIALAPAEHLGALIHAGQQAARGEGVVVGRIARRLIALAQFDGVHVQPMRQLIHRAFEREHPDRLARRAHGAGQHEIEAHDFMRDEPIVSGVKKLRRNPGWLEKVLPLQIAAKSFMRDGGKRSILGGSEAHMLLRVGTTHRRFEHLRARHDDFHRPLQLLRRQRRRDGFGRDPQLRSKAAAHIFGDESNLFFRHVESIGHLLPG